MRWSTILAVATLLIVPLNGASVLPASTDTEGLEGIATPHEPYLERALEIQRQFEDLEGSAAYVAAAATVAGYQVHTPELQVTEDPLAVLVEAGRVAHELQTEALSAMSPAAWQTVHAGAEAGIELLPLADADGALRAQAPDGAMEAAWAGLEALVVEQELMWQATYTIAVGLDRALALIDAGAPLEARTMETELGLAAVAAASSSSSCDDFYTTQVFVLIEECGDDVYVAPAGSATGPFAISIILDLEGNDWGIPDTPPSGSLAGPAYASGIFGGISVVLDVKGNDIRGFGPHPPGALMGTGHGIIGGAGATGGVGVLLDHAGQDEYLVDGFGDVGGKWGSGYFSGIGLLVDVQGDDRYGGDTLEEGSGWLGDAVGILVDVDGDDTYYDLSTLAQGSGGVGGIGVQVDLLGDDLYIADSPISQGAGSCHGIGILVDAHGADVYAAQGGFSQGFGTEDPLFHCSDEVGRRPNSPPTYDQDPLGVLADVRGDDQYIGGTYTQGAHLGQGVGVLADLDGADRYEADNCAQAFGYGGPLDPCENTGTTVTTGLAVLFDAMGRDDYWLIGGLGQGWHGSGGDAYLIDLLGLDTYNNGVVDGGGVQGPRGVGGTAIDLFTFP